ncbi:hypothetical protein COEREDRAFT_32893, partial [Coemansia reversa NRRL 1564]
LLYYRNELVVLMITGACICVASAKVLKQLIRQKRPPSNRNTSRTFGMPSTHSAGLIYFVTFIVLVAQSASKEHGLSKRHALVSTFALCVVGSAAAISRVLNGHHTLAQVIAGSCLGASFASVWW